MLAAMKDSDLLTEGVEPPDRVWSIKSRASGDQYAHTYFRIDQAYYDCRGRILSPYSGGLSNNV